MLVVYLKTHINYIKYNNKMIEDVIDSHTWFLAVQRAYKKIHGSDMTEDDLMGIDMVELSQMIMDDCTVNSIDDFYDIITRITDTEEEE